MKELVVFDIEVLKNCFLCCLYFTQSKRWLTIEISDRKNELNLIKEIFESPDYLFVGYNNIHYDTPIISYALMHYRKMANSTALEVCDSFYKLSDTIINGDQFSWMKYKFARFFEQIDLLSMLFSSALRVSLKEMQVTMCYKNVQEMNHNWKLPIGEDKIDELIEYCINDVDSTTELLRRCKKDLVLRKSIKKQYGINCLSMDGMKIGISILEDIYCEETGLDKRDLKELGSPRESINLAECIQPNIEFMDPKLKALFETIKATTITGTKGVLNHEVLFDGLIYTIQTGGIHSKNHPEVLRSDDEYILIDCDVTSMYPSLLIKYGFIPEHLGKVFLEIYERIYHERLEAKSLQKKDPAMATKQELFKLALNGTYGNLINEHSWLYDPKAAMSITVNGQLMLLMLAEQLTAIGCKIVMANTDGLTAKVPRAKLEEYYKVCNEWVERTQLGLEYVNYDSMYIAAVNDYIAVKEGYYDLPKDDVKTRKEYIKEKGMFIREARLGKGLDSLIIPKALVAYFVDKENVDETIRKSTDIWDFIKFQKVSKQFTVEWMEKEQQRTNRYYVSKKAPYLYKVKDVEKRGKNGGMVKEKQRNAMLKGWGVQLFNKYEQKQMNEYDINYAYYISKAKEVINDLESKQMTLFD